VDVFGGAGRGFARVYMLDFMSGKAPSTHPVDLFEAEGGPCPTRANVCDSVLLRAWHRGAPRKPEYMALTRCAVHDARPTRRRPFEKNWIVRIACFQSLPNVSASSIVHTVLRLVRFFYFASSVSFIARFHFTR